jgi:hypothetical protein
VRISEAIKALQGEKRCLTDVELFVRQHDGTVLPLTEISVLPGNVLELYTDAPDSEPKEP